MPSLLLLQAQQVPRGGAAAISRDTLFRAQDTLAGVAGTVRDTLEPAPLPGGVANVVRFLFQLPQWLQIGGAVLGAVVAVVVVVILWRRRRAIWAWLVSRTRAWQAALGGAALLVVLLATFAGVKSWNYTQHDNGFCSGCHVMNRPFDLFQAGAGKHANLSCHNCHEQSMYANIRQLVLWVAERPTEIGPHARVPNSRCEGCHQIAGSEEPWRHVLQLAGHKVHFGSDSTVLQGLTCVKCHGAEIHRFIPSIRACQQSGCHVQQSVRLAGMAKLPTINCVTCHAFRADLPALASHDSAIRALVPSRTQCLSCHGMQGRPTAYDPAKDPHKGSCGSCHDVHTDTKPSDARTSCVRCHAAAAQNAFHTGANHRAVATQCLVCHQPHAASVDASDCVGCHKAVQQRGLFHPPLPFDTSAVLRRRPASGGGAPAAPADDERPEDHRGKGDVLPVDLPPVRDAPDHEAIAATDTFPHSRHTSLPCLTCHTVNSPNGAYGLVFDIPRGCDLCHHQSFIAGKVDAQDCQRCHAAAVLAAPRAMTVKVAVDDHPPNPRTVDFRHDRHAGVTCGTCHRAPDIEPPDSVRRCAACHAEHHAPARNCSACHSRAETPVAHSRTTHTGCDACHTPANIAPLVPNRNLCLVCHAPQQAHEPGRECTTCHFLATPTSYQPRLMRAGIR